MKYIVTKFQVHIFENAKVCHRVLFMRRIVPKKRVITDIKSSINHNIMELMVDLDFNT
jgi:hypothetical protein